MKGVVVSSSDDIQEKRPQNARMLRSFERLIFVLKRISTKRNLFLAGFS
jgi:hypothetical protein